MADSSLTILDRVILVVTLGSVAAVGATGAYVAQQAADDAHDAVEQVAESQTRAEEQRHDTCLRSRQDTKDAITATITWVTTQIDDTELAGRLVDGLGPILETTLPASFCRDVGRP